MPGRHLLTFELSAKGEELSIYGDANGLRLLAERVASLAAQGNGGERNGTLSMSVWAGHEISLEPQGNDTRMIYHVRVFVVV